MLSATENRNSTISSHRNPWPHLSFDFVIFKALLHLIVISSLFDLCETVYLALLKRGD